MSDRADDWQYSLTGYIECPGIPNREICPQPCEHLSQHDAREGRTCPEHPCTCTDRRERERAMTFPWEEPHEFTPCKCGCNAADLCDVCGDLHDEIFGTDREDGSTR